MEDHEKRHGRTLVPVGATVPFPVPEKDWRAVVISVADQRARIILVDAANPQTGAFRRLIIAIEQAGFIPVVCEPIGSLMPAIMLRWGWKRRMRGYGFDRCEEWQPRRARA